jgi:methyl acetate hydrolase
VGLGCLPTTDDAPAGRAAGSWAWAGLANTYDWIDPARRLTGVLLTQIMPFGDAGVLGLSAEFGRAIYAGHAEGGYGQVEEPTRRDAAPVRLTNPRFLR